MAQESCSEGHRAGRGESELRFYSQHWFPLNVTFNVPKLKLPPFYWLLVTVLSDGLHGCVWTPVTTVKSLRNWGLLQGDQFCHIFIKVWATIFFPYILTYFKFYPYLALLCK